MPDLVFSLLAYFLGLLIYVSGPTIAPAVGVETRDRIGTFYFGMSMKSWQQVAIVRRVIGGYDQLRIDVDDEEKNLLVTLSSGFAGRKAKKLPFRDPDNRIKLLFHKPLALVYEEVPAAISAELAEVGHAIGKHELWDGNVVDPYLPIEKALKLVDPAWVHELVGNDVEPENIETARRLTRERFAKYKESVGKTEIAAGLLGFAVGAGGVFALQFANEKFLDGSGGGSVPSVEIGLPFIFDIVGVFI